MKPGWLLVTVSKRNRWQRLAARTNGLVTPPNVITMAGAALVIVGLSLLLAGEYWYGGVLVAVGRLADVLDGWVAESTGTKSRLGELLDAAVDKVVTGLMILACFVMMLAPWWLLVVLLMPQIIAVVLAAIDRSGKRKLQPSRAGKLSMALLWVSLVGLIVLRALQSPQPLVVVVAVAMTGAIIFGMYAAWQYAGVLVKSDRP